MIIYLSIVLVGLILIIIAILMLISPGKPERITDKNGNHIKNSISEKIFVEINGINQGMFIRGADSSNPLILFVHGGPAFPEYFLFDKFKVNLEDKFTVCYWEQRGGGLSYNSDIKPESISFEQLKSDLVEVTKYLLKRFNKTKLVLMAHSGGTTFGIQAAISNPELFYAYIGIAQITNQTESEKLAFNYMLEEYKRLNNHKKTEELKSFTISESVSETKRFYKSLTRDESMHELGIGTMRNMNSVFNDVFLAVWRCRAYTLTEKLNYWRSKFFFIRKTSLIDELFKNDISKKYKKFEIPIIMISGKYDYTVNYSLSQNYFTKIDAPLKKFYLFDNSAHSPIFEEPEKFSKIIFDEIAGFIK